MSVCQLKQLFLGFGVPHLYGGVLVARDHVRFGTANMGVVALTICVDDSDGVESVYVPELYGLIHRSRHHLLCTKYELSRSNRVLMGAKMALSFHGP